jgi:hypothetical protein
MCPFCLASIGLIVASATSAGGLTALAVKLSQKKNQGKEVTLNSKETSTTGQGQRIGLAGKRTSHASS